MPRSSTQEEVDRGTSHDYLEESRTGCTQSEKCSPDTEHSSLPQASAAGARLAVAYLLPVTPTQQPSQVVVAAQPSTQPPVAGQVQAVHPQFLMHEDQVMMAKESQINQDHMALFETPKQLPQPPVHVAYTTKPLSGVSQVVMVSACMIITVVCVCVHVCVCVCVCV